MITFSFTVSPFLRTELDEIDKLRVKTLTALLPHSTETVLQWEANLERVYSTFQLMGKPVKKQQILQAIRKHDRTLTPTEKEIMALKNNFTLAHINWFMNSQPLDFQTLNALHKALSNRDLSTHKKDLDLMFSFIQSNPEHPVLQAALARILTYQTLGDNETGHRLGSMLAWIFLVKHGYDFNRLLIHEEDFVRRHSPTLTTSMQTSLTNRNISPFLEYYAHGVLTSAEKARKMSSSTRQERGSVAVQLKLTDRQKEILVYLEKPGSKISNKIVQKQFGVSQITASRDLARLVELDLVYPVGRGRSAEYMKV